MPCSSWPRTPVSCENCPARRDAQGAHHPGPNPEASLKRGPSRRGTQRRCLEICFNLGGVFFNHDSITGPDDGRFHNARPYTFRIHWKLVRFFASWYHPARPSMVFFIPNQEPAEMEIVIRNHPERHKQRLSHRAGVRGDCPFHCDSGTSAGPCLAEG